MKKVVIALGGNALGITNEEQVKNTIKEVFNKMPTKEKYELLVGNEN